VEKADGAFSTATSNRDLDHCGQRRTWIRRSDRQRLLDALSEQPARQVLVVPLLGVFGELEGGPVGVDLVHERRETTGVRQKLPAECLRVLHC